MREQEQKEKPLTTDGAGPSKCHDECSQQPLSEEKACQTDDAIAPPAEEGDLVFHEEALSRACASCSTCGVGSVDPIIDVASIESPPAATAALEDETEKRIVAATASAAVAQVGATAWASAFSAASQLFHAALISLCHEAIGGPSEDDGRQAFEVPLLSGMEAPGSKEASSSAVVSWVPGEAEADAAMALQALRDSVQSAVEGVRLAAGRTAQKTVPPASSVATTGSQTVPEPPAAIIPVASQNTTESQTDKEPQWNAPGAKNHVGVQAGGRPSGWNAEPFSGGGGAPAWEGHMDGRCLEGGRVDGDGKLRIKQGNGRMEGLERTAEALSRALQRAEVEKEGLQLMLTRRFEQEKVRVLDIVSS